MTTSPLALRPLTIPLVPLSPSPIVGANGVPVKLALPSAEFPPLRELLLPFLLMGELTACPLPDRLSLGVFVARGEDVSRGDDLGLLGPASEDMLVRGEMTGLRREEFASCSTGVIRVRATLSVIVGINLAL